MMPLLAAIPYSEAVELAHKAPRLSPLQQSRLLAYLAGWTPEIVATAMEDLGLHRMAIEPVHAGCD